MKRLFLYAISILFAQNLFSQDEICILHKDGTEECFSLNDIDKIYMKPSEFKASGEFLNREYVDLGLPSGLLWATYDVGAKGFKQLGNYYSWGELDTFDTYDYNKLKQYRVDNPIGGFSKYTTSLYYNAEPDSIITLLPEDDVATVDWGNGWRMATKEEWQELIDGCTWEGVISPDVLVQYCSTCTPEPAYSLVGTSKYNGVKIFFPGGCSKYGSSIELTTKYWTSSLCVENDFHAVHVSLVQIAGERPTGIDFYHESRSMGCAIRPVTHGR